MKTTHDASESTLPVVVGVAIVAVSYIVLTGLLASDSAWMSLVANSFMPFVLVPALIVLVARVRRQIVAGMLGAASSVIMVVVFYGVAESSSDYAIDMQGPRFWAVAGLVSGALVGTGSWLLTHRLRGDRLFLKASLTILFTASVAAPFVFGGPMLASEALALSVASFLWCAVAYACVTRATG